MLEANAEGISRAGGRGVAIPGSIAVSLRRKGDLKTAVVVAEETAARAATDQPVQCSSAF